MANFQDGIGDALSAAGLQKTSARREIKILQDLMKQDPTGGRANALLKQMGERGYDPRKYIQEIGAGQEGIADLIAAPAGMAGEYPQLAVQKNMVPGLAFNHPAAIQRKLDYYDEIANKNPELFAELYGVEDLGTGGGKAMYHPYMPGPEVGDLPYDQQAAILGRGWPFPPGPLQQKVQQAENAVPGVGLRAGDMHGGNVRLDAEGNPKVVDILVNDPGAYSPNYRPGEQPEVWGFRGGGNFEQRVPGEADYDYLQRMAEPGGAEHVRQAPGREGRIGGAMKAKIHRGVPMDDIIFPEGKEQYIEAARRSADGPAPSPRAAAPAFSSYKPAPTGGELQPGFGTGSLDDYLSQRNAVRRYQGLPEYSMSDILPGNASAEGIGMAYPNLSMDPSTDQVRDWVKQLNARKAQYRGEELPIPPSGPLAAPRAGARADYAPEDKPWEGYSAYNAARQARRKEVNRARGWSVSGDAPAPAVSDAPLALSPPAASSASGGGGLVGRLQARLNQMLGEAGIAPGASSAPGPGTAAALPRHQTPPKPAHAPARAPKPGDQQPARAPKPAARPAARRAPAPEAPAGVEEAPELASPTMRERWDELSPAARAAAVGIPVGVGLGGVGYAMHKRQQEEAPWYQRMMGG